MFCVIARGELLSCLGHRLQHRQTGEGERESLLAPFNLHQKLLYCMLQYNTLNTFTEHCTMHKLHKTIIITVKDHAIITLQHRILIP